MSAAKLGVKKALFTEEHRANISKATKGKPHRKVNPDNAADNDHSIMCSIHCDALDGIEL
jgi:hypothetical protein